MDSIIYEALGIGLLLGTLLGLTGAGGSLVALPLLLSLHLPLRDAIGVSLGAVGLSALIGALGRWRSGDVHITPVILLTISGLPGSWIGQQLGQWISEFWLVLGFCALVLWSAWRMWNNASLPEVADKRSLNRGMLIFIGLWVGVLSGLMGVGGGFLIVPALLWFSPLSMLAATATSMAVIAIVSSAGFFIYLSTAQPQLQLLTGLGAGGVIGVLIGNRLAQHLGGPVLQRIFAIMLLSVSLSLAAQKLFHISG
ncbi:sulfite exporter TauE/SafE family protein [Denitrificimonas sp. JX-1]|uniref:Probable membrane transporter protein n=1 Tax=Denitrificimonas halotolerans TaxID=3098930 RepID=A0ABU5GN77_9GAMM|nr:sulfite exporter TauE/SafE family protein [Denitrificimonas sp. JX-1]MDY7218164.1 sulfite exporter TauE/SafE family protein [Denitrificimonas sp. JX-1]